MNPNVRLYHITIFKVYLFQHNTWPVQQLSKHAVCSIRRGEPAAVPGCDRRQVPAAGDEHQERGRHTQVFNFSMYLFSHMTSLISALEQQVEKSLSFATCKITCNATLSDKAYLFLELAVTADRTRFISLK